jgi:L-prolyl-PCP dehydrogenase
MDFCWTNAHHELYDRILEFAHNISRAPRSISSQDRDIWQQCGEKGLTGLCVPGAYGGLGLDALSTACALEAFGCGCEDMGLVFAIAAHLLACAMPLVEFGNAEQKAKLLPRLCSGTWIGANAITERDAGSDVFALKTSAYQSGTDYVLTGQKSYVTNGPLADVFIVYASTNPKLQLA